VTAADPFAGPAVIDASVGLKWLLPEPGAEAALHLRSRLVEEGAGVYVPDLFWAEAANVLWRLTRSGAARLEAEEARELLEVLLAAPLSTEPVGSVASRALEIACETGATAYDAAYVAVAELRRARLWTADRRLVATLAGTPWGGLVSHIGA
jgi:predicted nucleic acid-binding protein